MTDCNDEPIPNKLITGGSANPFLPHLCASIHAADEIEMAVAFVMATGLRLLMPDLLAALEDSDSEDSGRKPTPAKMRILTSDYLDVTDPLALRLLLILQERGAEVRVYESAGSSFHLKAYMFAGKTVAGQSWGRAFIGSSNISRQALQLGLEWNFRVDFPGNSGYLEARARFNELFNSQKTCSLSHRWIDEYEKRRIKPIQAITPGDQENDPIPSPNAVQHEALVALTQTRIDHYLKGLVVMATGLGKTWLAAFDAAQMNARRVLFIAHREEILDQAAATFSRVRPTASIGFFKGQQRNIHVDFLFASIQTLGKSEHLSRFDPRHFDYIIVDEFHHAAAPTYHRLLNHFLPSFLLGLTATPDRTDNANILSLCDDNLVYESSLFVGVSRKLLVPFHYYGIFDDDVDYQSIPWRNGRFDPEQLAHRLATLGRAKHALSTWRVHAQHKTLAFCVSTRHADYMTEYFLKQGVKAAAVYANSQLSRGEALEQLSDGSLEILFSVDLFNEGIDLPSIDTVMMLRPTESKILFLQQLGRGLRRANQKEKLIVLDFVANHQSFLHKPQALMNTSMNHGELAAFARKAEQNKLELPEGCYVNFDLRFIDFLKALDSGSIRRDYESLRESLDHRPTLTEFYRFGANLTKVRQEYGGWFEFVMAMKDLSAEEEVLVEKHGRFLKEVETTSMNKSFKAILLEAFQELNGWEEAPSVSILASKSWEVLKRRRPLLTDLPEEYRSLESPPSEWQTYWRKNPINAWIGGNMGKSKEIFFSVETDYFLPTFRVKPELLSIFSELVQDLVNFRLTTYIARESLSTATVVALKPGKSQTQLPYFPNLKIACGHFKTATADAEEYRSIGTKYGNFDASRHFIARASGNSMNGGKSPIHDGDYLLLEVIKPEMAGSITNDIIAIERQDEAQNNQYLLRRVLKDADGQYRLKANNPDYEDIVVTDELSEQLRTFARLKTILDPLEMVIGERFMREDVPKLFNVEYNPGNWNSGHVRLPAKGAVVLLITINKQGRTKDHRFIDHWIDDDHFHWQSQNQTSPNSKSGQEVISHERLGVHIHLFVRENKLEGGKAAPFTYHGTVKYQSHTGSEPMNVIFKLDR